MTLQLHLGQRHPARPPGRPTRPLHLEFFRLPVERRVAKRGVEEQVAGKQIKRVRGDQRQQRPPCPTQQATLGIRGRIHRGSMPEAASSRQRRRRCRQALFHFRIAQRLHRRSHGRCWRERPGFQPPMPGRVHATATIPGRTAAGRATTTTRCMQRVAHVRHCRRRGCFPRQVALLHFLLQHGRRPQFLIARDRRPRPQPGNGPMFRIQTEIAAAHAGRAGDHVPWLVHDEAVQPRAQVLMQHRQLHQHHEQQHSPRRWRALMHCPTVTGAGHSRAMCSRHPQRGIDES